MSKGIVRRFNNQRGFGFISDSDDIIQGQKGPQAVNVTKL